MSLKLPIDFAKKIADTLTLKTEAVEELFDIEERKDGFFYAVLKPKQFLDKFQFRAMCKLVKDLGGQDYLQGAKAWAVPGPYAKKGGVTPQDTSKSEVDKTMSYSLEVPITALTHMSFRSRSNIDGPEFEDLVESVKQCGILEPLIVRHMKNSLYEIIAGERRFAAAQRVGLANIPVVIKAFSDQQAYEIQLIENVQRKDLSDMEKARMLDYVIKTFKLTQEQLASKIGKTQGWISQHLSMLQVPESITRVIKHGELTEGQAREILAAPEDKRDQIIDRINKTGEVPSGREIHSIVHPEEAKPGVPPPIGTVKPQDMTVGKAKELLDTPAGKEVLEIAVKERLAEGPSRGTSESEDEEPLYADSIKWKPDSPESIPKAREPGKESIPRLEDPARGHPINIGDFTCDQCHKTFMIRHLPSGKHSLVPVREEQ
jgi:ParB family chromosome partitioning protein